MAEQPVWLFKNAITAITEAGTKRQHGNPKKRIVRPDNRKSTSSRKNTINQPMQAVQ